MQVQIAALRRGGVDYYPPITAQYREAQRKQLTTHRIRKIHCKTTHKVNACRDKHVHVCVYILSSPSSPSPSAHRYTLFVIIRAFVHLCVLLTGYPPPTTASQAISTPSLNILRIPVTKSYEPETRIQRVDISKGVLKKSKEHAGSQPARVPRSHMHTCIAPPNLFLRPTALACAETFRTPWVGNEPASRYPSARYCPSQEYLGVLRPLVACGLSYEHSGTDLLTYLTNAPSRGHLDT